MGFRISRIKIALIWLLFFSSICIADISVYAETLPNYSKFLRAESTLDIENLGINAFVNDSRFGSISSQLLEVRDTLHLNFVRVLFAWDDNVQPSPHTLPNFSFYDEIIRSLPDQMDALVILTGVPSWMHDKANWLNGDPRETFVKLWVKKVVSRYRNKKKIIGWELWNEPNMSSNPDNVLLSINRDASNYVAMAASAKKIIDRYTPNKLLVGASTTAIDQGYPRTLRYNKALRNSGLKSIVDVWGIHYYGTHIENLLRPNGVSQFLNSLHKTLWITETGEKGVNNQKDYITDIIPFIKSFIPKIDRTYIYQFTEDSPPEKTYGLRNPSSDYPVSDLYIYLRDR